MLTSRIALALRLEPCTAGDLVLIGFLLLVEILGIVELLVTTELLVTPCGHNASRICFGLLNILNLGVVAFVNR